MSITDCCGVCPPRPEVWGRRVLIVNPDLAKAYLLLFELEAVGAEVIAVENSAQALAICASFNPDVLISKLPLPDEDSISMLNKLKGKVAKQGRKILAISIMPFSGATSQNDSIREKSHHCIMESLGNTSVTEQIKRLLSLEYRPV